MSANNGGPAFPVTRYVNVDGETHESKPQGMTLRDYFAAKALPAVISDKWYEGQTSRSFYDLAPAIARDAYTLADAMLEAREP